jgi:hypothetical protein
MTTTLRLCNGFDDERSTPASANFGDPIDPEDHSALRAQPLGCAAGIITVGIDLESKSRRKKWPIPDRPSIRFGVSPTPYLPVEAGAAASVPCRYSVHRDTRPPCRAVRRRGPRAPICGGPASSRARPLICPVISMRISTPQSRRSTVHRRSILVWRGLGVAAAFSGRLRANPNGVVGAVGADQPVYRAGAFSVPRRRMPHPRDKGQVLAGRIDRFGKDMGDTQTLLRDAARRHCRDRHRSLTVGPARHRRRSLMVGPAPDRQQAGGVGLGAAGDR